MNTDNPIAKLQSAINKARAGIPCDQAQVSAYRQLKANDADSTLQRVALSQVPKGAYVRRQLDSKTTYKREHYVREERKYCLSDCDDVNREIFLSGKTLVWVGFEY